MLYFHKPGLAAMHQTTHTSSVYQAFNLSTFSNDTPLPVSRCKSVL